MDIKSMHYDFKKKLNKVDSQQYKNLRVPEIDWVLNEALSVFIELITHPRKFTTHLGFERTQRTTDDIRPLVVPIDHSLGIATVGNGVFALPSDYRHFNAAEVKMSRTGCTDKIGRVFIRQQDDEFENSPFDRSSFEWKTVNGIFSGTTMKLFDDDTFTNEELYLGYIKNPVYIHNAEAFNVAGYNMPNGDTLTGSVDCELPDHTHREILDIAVLITTGEIENQLGYQFKERKFDLNINN